MQQNDQVDHVHTDFDNALSTCDKRYRSRKKPYGLREPEFIGGEVDLRINIYRNQLNAASAAQDIPQHNVSADK